MLKAISSVSAACSPSRLRGAGVEFAWSATHAALYPLGLAAERAHILDAPSSLAHLRPWQRGLLHGDADVARMPILLVHGFIDNRTIFSVLRRRLRRRGFGHVESLSYSPLTADIRGAARDLSARVERICQETGQDQVQIVGHSMGGIVARYYVQRLGGAHRVRTIVTLASPHGGTVAARLLPYPIIRQLRPQSDLIQELAEPIPGGCSTRFVAFYSDIDHLVVPHTRGRILHADLNARNILVPSVGHMSMPVVGRVVHEISNILANNDEGGLGAGPNEFAPAGEIIDLDQARASLG